MHTKVFLTVFFLIGLLLTLSAEALAEPQERRYEKKRTPVAPARRLTIPVAPGGQFEKKPTSGVPGGQLQKKPTPVAPPGGYHTEQLKVEPQPSQYKYQRAPDPQPPQYQSPVPPSQMEQRVREPQPSQYQAPVPEGQFAPQAPEYQAPAPPTGRTPAQDQKAAPPKYQNPDEWSPRGTK
jgi:hypothetical protein